MIQAIMATWAFDEAKKRAELSRNCPQCRREQQASHEKINSMITCEKCGSEIPPKIVADNKAKKNKQNRK
jgi:uncharacterized Zn finger protein